MALPPPGPPPGGAPMGGPPMSGPPPMAGPPGGGGAPPIPPEALHQFLTSHPIGRAIAAHTGYGPGHPMHDIHHRRMARPTPARTPAAPSALGGHPMMAPPGAAPPQAPMPMPGASPLGAVPPPPRGPMPMPAPQAGGARPPLPAQGAMPQGPPR